MLRKDQIQATLAKIAGFASMTDPELPGVHTTIRDWQRNIGGKTSAIYFNGELAFTPDEGTTLNATQLENKIDANFKGINPKIKDYILRYANQAGFLQISEDVTKSFAISERNKGFECTTRSDFIQNQDGSVTYIETFYINNYFNIANLKEKITAEDGRPLAIGRMTTKICLNEKEEVEPQVLKDKIVLTSPQAEELIPDQDISSDTIIETRYQEPIKQIEEELKPHLRISLSKNIVTSSAAGNLDVPSKQLAVASEEENASEKQESSGITFEQLFAQQSKPNPENKTSPKSGFVANTKEFLKQHWGKILIAGVITGLVAGAIVAGLFSFGIGTVAVGAIGGGVVAGLGLLGLKIGAGVGIGLGTAAVVKGSIIVGASAGVAVGTAIESYQNRNSQSNIRKGLAAKSTASRSTKDKERSTRPEAQSNSFGSFVKSFFTHDDTKKTDVKNNEDKVQQSDSQLPHRKNRR